MISKPLIFSNSRLRIHKTLVSQYSLAATTACSTSALLRDDHSSYSAIPYGDDQSPTGQEGLEPPTNSLEVNCSIHLSY